MQASKGRLAGGFGRTGEESASETWMGGNDLEGTTERKGEGIPGLPETEETMGRSSIPYRYQDVSQSPQTEVVALRSHCHRQVQDCLPQSGRGDITPTLTRRWTDWNRQLFWLHQRAEAPSVSHHDQVWRDGWDWRVPAETSLQRRPEPCTSRKM